jgi:RNA polymerase sigma factor (TIGR02999 family)
MHSISVRSRFHPDDKRWQTIEQMKSNSPLPRARDTELARAGSSSRDCLLYRRGRCAKFWSVGEITLILGRLGHGDQRAAEDLMRLVYGELRRLAAAKMSHEAAGQTLQPTALVHEAWLRLGGDAQPDWQNRRHFFAAAAEAMRRILIERARRRAAARHGSGQEHLDTDELELAADSPPEQVLAVNDALEKLAAIDPRRAELVKLRYFAGFSIEDAARTLDVSLTTANRWWVFARAWLFAELKGAEEKDKRS